MHAICNYFVFRVKGLQTMEKQSHCLPAQAHQYKHAKNIVLSNSEWSEVYTHADRVCMASLRASKISFSLATLSRAPSPAPRKSNKVSYLHRERKQLQGYSIAELDSPIELFFATSKMKCPFLAQACPVIHFHHRQHKLWTIHWLTLIFNSITSVFQSKHFRPVIFFCIEWPSHGQQQGRVPVSRGDIHIMSDRPAWAWHTCSVTQRIKAWS